MPFTPGWFGATFPIGALALGGILLGPSTAARPVTWMGQTAAVVLVGTVSPALVGAVVRLARSRFSASVENRRIPRFLRSAW
ncbi:hypothetical protein [Actinomyces respiraculi]|uniref:Uncharacterized protein n=1 Tax=Actinomyces respiraculi TaxID=2744574 RepID=A0A7T0LMA9_9ACTO|nr:hypothetical protein ID810_05910 [Actinomyces respiraculi]